MDDYIPHSRPTVGAAEAEAAKRVVLSGAMAQGDEVRAFEEEVAAMVGRRFGVAVASGTVGLQFALISLDIKSGDEVIIPSYVCTALLHAVRSVGARPVLADIDFSTRSLAIEQVKHQQTPATRAVIVPHMFGAMVPGELAELGIPVIEDCAMGFGGRYGKCKVGSWGKLAVCSFYATKVICSGGEGGMILTDDEELVRTLRGLREYDGMTTECLRYNGKMSDIAAAIGRIQLQRLPGFLECRRNLAARYSAALAKTDLQLPEAVPGHIYYRYVVHLEHQADVLLNYLEKMGIAARRPIPRPLHRELEQADSKYPQTAKAYLGDISLPLYPSLADKEVERVLSAVCSASKRRIELET